MQNPAFHWNLKWTSRKLQNVCEKIHEIHLVSDYVWSHMIWCFGYYARCVCSMSVFFIHHCLRWRKYINRERKKESVTAMMASGIRLFRLHINHICMQIRKEIQMTMAFILIDNFRNVHNPCVFTVHTVPKKSSKENFVQHQLLNIINVNIQNKLMQRLTLSKSKSKQ